MGALFSLWVRTENNETVIARGMHLINLSLKMTKILAVELKCICSQMSTTTPFFFASEPRSLLIHGWKRSQITDIWQEKWGLLRRGGEVEDGERIKMR